MWMMCSVQSLSYPEQRNSGTIYKTVDELVEQLRKQGVLYDCLLYTILKLRKYYATKYSA